MHKVSNLQNNSNITKIQPQRPIKQNLSLSNPTLMKQKLAIGQQNQSSHTSTKVPDQIQTTNKLSQNYVNQMINSKEQKINVVNAVKKKIYEIIHLCQRHSKNNKEDDQVDQIVEAQRQILTTLNKKLKQNTYEQKFSKNRSLQTENSPHKTKIKNNKTQISISQLHNPQLSYLKHEVDDQTVQIIKQIQQKTLLEIENLREDKINLMKKLNEEIKAHNQQKRKRTILEKQNQIMEQSRSSSLNNDKISDNTQITITLGKNSHEDQSNEFWSDPFVKGNSSQNPHQFYNNIQPHQQLIQQKQLNLVNPQNIKVSPIVGNSHQHIQQLEKHKYNNYNNEKFKTSITNIPNNTQLKSELLAELHHLSARILQYKSILNEKNEKKESSNMRQVKNLIKEGNKLSEQGNILFNNRKKSQPRSGAGLYAMERSNNRTNKSLIEKKNIGGIMKKIQKNDDGGESRPTLMTFCPADRHKYSRGYHRGFESEQYEQIIEKMKQAMRN